MKRKMQNAILFHLIVAWMMTLATVGLFTLAALAALLFSGCQTVGDSDLDDDDAWFEDTDTGTDTEPPDDGIARYWLVVIDAQISTITNDTEDWLPDPVATVYRGGDVMGRSASCDLNTFEPRWDDHTSAMTAVEWTSDTWTLVVTDWQLEPGPRDWVGGCELDVSPFQIEHEQFLSLKDCGGGLEFVNIRFERYEGPIDLESERDPDC